MLEPIHLLQVLHDLHGLLEAERVFTAEGVAMLGPWAAPLRFCASIPSSLRSPGSCTSDSMSGDQRRELMQLMQSLVQDPGLRNELGMLAQNLEELRPMDDLRRRYPFRGEDSLSFEQAMQVMQDLQEMDRLERQMREAIDTADPNTIDRDMLARQLGEDAKDQLDQLEQITKLLEEAGLVERRGDQLELTPRAIRKIGQKALKDIFQHLARDRFGNHEADHRGRGGDRSDDTKQYEFGDPFLLDLRVDAAELTGSQRRRGPVKLAPPDFEVYRTEQMNQASTVLLLDLSRSMIYRGCSWPPRKWRWRSTV